LALLQDGSVLRAAHVKLSLVISLGLLRRIRMPFKIFVEIEMQVPFSLCFSGFNEISEGTAFNDRKGQC